MNAYAVIYDRWDNNEHDWVDDMYEAFSTPEEAAKMFRALAHGTEMTFRNPRVVQILHPVSPPDGEVWG